MLWHFFQTAVFPLLSSSSVMSSSLDSTYGVWFASLFLETILYGCGLLQTWLYFRWYTKDHWTIKAMVTLLVIFETLQVSFLFASTYRCLITNFGNIPNLFVINWMDSAQLLSGYLSALTVQLYFAYCIYILDKKNKFPPILITALALTQIGAGIAQTTVTTELGSFLNLESTKHTTTLQSASALCCDVAITVCLLRTLNGRKTGIKATNSLLNTLMINAVNRGILTAVSAALNMILFLSIPNTFYFFLGLMSSSKLYMNSALATLNSRQHILKKTYPTTTDNWRSIQLEALSTTKPASESLVQTPHRHFGTVATNDHVQVTVQTETFNTSSGTYIDQKHTFIDGMV
ncbi:hypothetical protein CPB84DRAFT_1783871 [Gymnopilus junonius]|uniref:DUF6534 domain-containing protein n=1 Tax=Gymnopilus junonius TaxID=109634 RepID=A0A9P5NJ82_GYMJU|nr:hypothetical protein CPB84DRAFT_1783871 [Gymnopilus junonius]